MVRGVLVGCGASAGAQSGDCGVDATATTHARGAHRIVAAGEKKKGKASLRVRFTIRRALDAAG